MKNFYFISGFPRSGNTLLTSILNQNPDIFSTGISSLPDIFYRLVLMTAESESYLTSPSDENLHSLFTNIFETYYKNHQEKYIIERGNWITPFSFPILNDYCPNEVKVIILVRSIKDIVKSYLNICKKSPLFYVNQIYNEMDKTTLYKSEIEEKIDIIFRKDDWMDRTLYSLKWLIDNNHTESVRFLDYDDFVENPKQSLECLYEYFEIPKFNHKFEDLEQVSKYGVIYRDMEHLRADLHTIREEKVNKVNHNIDLPEHIIERCNRLEMWKGNIKNLITNKY